MARVTCSTHIILIVSHHPVGSSLLQPLIYSFGPTRFKESRSKVTWLVGGRGDSNSVLSFAKAEALSIKLLYSQAKHLLRTYHMQNPGAMINVQMNEEWVALAFQGCNF